MICTILYASHLCRTHLHAVLHPRLHAKFEASHPAPYRLRLTILISWNGHPMVTSIDMDSSGSMSDRPFVIMSLLHPRFPPIRPQLWDPVFRNILSKSPRLNLLDSIARIQGPSLVPRMDEPLSLGRTWKHNSGLLLGAERVDHGCYRLLDLSDRDIVVELTSRS